MPDQTPPGQTPDETPDQPVTPDYLSSYPAAHEPTRPLPPTYAAATPAEQPTDGGPGPFGWTTSQAPTRPKKSGRAAFAAGVVAASLVLGGAAGLGGAAAYDEWFSTPPSTSSASAPVSTSPVVSSGEGDETGAQTNVEKVASAVLPSVVKLDVTGSQGSGSGSGIILSSDGEILTNNHVAEVAQDGGSITVAFDDGTTAPATIVGTDPLTDVAIVKAEGVSDLTPATIGDSDGLKVGEDVVAIGSPFGLDATVTSGIVSALNRAVDVGQDSEGKVTAYPAIQTDAAINPGNSGGPLVDSQGRVVGINASIRSSGNTTAGGEPGSIGLGFAIPIGEVLPIVDQIRNDEAPTHAILGVTIQPVGTTADGQPPQTGAVVGAGAEIKDVTDGSAAQDAGLQAGDVVTKINDTMITDTDSLIATIRSYRPDDQVQVTYTRDGSTETTQMTLGSDATSG